MDISFSYVLNRRHALRQALKIFGEEQIAGSLVLEELAVVHDVGVEREDPLEVAEALVLLLEFHDYLKFFFRELLYFLK